MNENRASLIIEVVVVGFELDLRRSNIPCLIHTSQRRY